MIWSKVKWSEKYNPKKVEIKREKRYPWTDRRSWTVIIRVVYAYSFKGKSNQHVSAVYHHILTQTKSLWAFDQIFDDDDVKETVIIIVAVSIIFNNLIKLVWRNTPKVSSPFNHPVEVANRCCNFQFNMIVKISIMIARKLMSPSNELVSCYVNIVTIKGTLQRDIEGFWCRKSHLFSHEMLNLCWKCSKLTDLP